MQQTKRYDILDGLPTYGPMYIPVSENGQPFYSEGFVVRFFMSDGSSWVANFARGWMGTNAIFDYAEYDRIIIVAGGKGYIMSPEEQTPISTFGGGIQYVFKTLQNQIAVTGELYVAIVDYTGVVWESERIFWDEIKDVKLEGNILSGLSYDPMDSVNEWKPFVLDLETKEITGGSFTPYLNNSRS